MEILLLGLIVVLLIALLVLQLNKSESRHQADLMRRMEGGLTDFMGRAQVSLTELQTYARSRLDLERQTSDSVRRLEAVIAGTYTKGLAGESILEFVLAKLPSEWQVRNFRVGNKVVEFGLRVPGNLVVPVDSKWPATGLLERFSACKSIPEKKRLRDEIEIVVFNKATEIRKYLDPNLTTNFGIAAVPDAVYDLCSVAPIEALKLRVVIVSYSMFLPYVLLVVDMMSRASQNIDLQRLDAHLGSVQSCVQEIQDELEGRFARAITMLNNSSGDIRAHLGKASSALTSLQIVSAEPTQNQQRDLPAL